MAAATRRMTRLEVRRFGAQTLLQCDRQLPRPSCPPAAVALPCRRPRSPPPADPQPCARRAQTVPGHLSSKILKEARAQQEEVDAAAGGGAAAQLAAAADAA